MDGFDKTICYREFSREAGRGDDPYYPVRLVDDEGLLKQYVGLAHATPKVTFVGRLGTYRYLDMDATIGEALSAADRLLELVASGGKIPAFFVTP